MEQLRQFPDLDKMLAGLSAVPKNITPKTAKVGIDTLIFLKQTLKVAPILAASLAGLRDRRPADTASGQSQRPSTGPLSVGNNPLLDALCSNLMDPQLGGLLNLLLASITESTEYSRSAHEMRHQECFALRNGIHGLLDVARKTFLQTVEDIYRVMRFL